MDWNNHYRREGQHSFLAPSSPAWVRYDEQRLEERWGTSQAAFRGTQLHELAMNMIRLNIKAADNGTTMSMYVNDAIGFNMQPEQMLYYSIHCFGTADAIGFRRNTLRIFDLKTGIKEVTGEQLRVYAALFCLEYKYKPFDIKYDLRIYQNDTVFQIEPEPDSIAHIMDKIVTHSRHLDEFIASV